MTAGSVNAAGTGQDVIANIAMQGLYSEGHLYSVIVKRVQVTSMMGLAMPEGEEGTGKVEVPPEVRPEELPRVETPEQQPVEA
jgi:hypothetical protein